jgi:hypothetical protein
MGHSWEPPLEPNGSRRHSATDALLAACVLAGVLALIVIATVSKH